MFVGSNFRELLCYETCLHLGANWDLFGSRPTLHQCTFQSSLYGNLYEVQIKGWSLIFRWSLFPMNPPVHSCSHSPKNLTSWHRSGRDIRLVFLVVAHQVNSCDTPLAPCISDIATGSLHFAKSTIQIFHHTAIWYWVHFSTHAYSSPILIQSSSHISSNIFKPPLNHTRVH